MEIFVAGKRDAADFTYHKPWAAIQISSHRGEWPDLKDENRVNSLQMQFLDTIHPGFESSFNEKRAKEIWSFVNEMWNKVEAFLIHCEMGISRSSAVAAAIHTTLLNEQPCLFFNPPYDPNRLVYKTMLDVINGNK